MARRVTVTGTIDGIDDETFGRNEVLHPVEFWRETILADSLPQNVMEMECRWGGECRVELRLWAQQLDNQAVRVTGNALLFEGTSEDTGDLDGRKEFDLLVPRGKTISDEQRVNNDDEGGDYATIKLTITNTIVEE